MESGDQMPIVPDASSAPHYRALVKAHIDTLTRRAAQQPVDYMLLNTTHAARLRAVPVPVDARSGWRGRGKPMSFLTPLFLLGLARPRGAGADSPDAARAQVGGRVSVADVPAQDSVRVGAAPAHSRLAAAGAAAGGDRADRRGVRAAVPARLGAGGARRRRARHRRAARSLLQHGLRRHVGARAARGARRRSRARRRPIASRWCCSRTSRKSRCDRRPIASRAVAEINAAAPGPGVDQVRARAEARRRACSPNRCCRARK